MEYYWNVPWIDIITSLQQEGNSARVGRLITKSTDMAKVNLKSTRNTSFANRIEIIVYSTGE